jgi:hypothetical protein
VGFVSCMTSFIHIDALAQSNRVDLVFVSPRLLLTFL